MQITGQCYCGKTRISAKNPLSVLLCHCGDCRRVSGAPVAAFVAFDEADLTVSSGNLQNVEVNSGVRREFCGNCGSPITGRYDYLSGTVYVSLGLLDQADALEPTLHAHHDNRLQWLHLSDHVERHGTSARDALP